MKRKLSTIAIRHKLLWIYTVVLLLTFAISFAAMILFQNIRSRAELLSQMKITGALTAERVTQALLLDESSEAGEALKHLATNPGIRSAVVFRPDHRTFASYHRNGEVHRAFPDPRTLDAETVDAYIVPKSGDPVFHRYAEDALEIAIPVYHLGTPIGTVHLNSDLNRLRSDSFNILLIGLGINFPCVLVSFVIVRRIVNTLSAPITNLATTATAVALNHDYSLRAEKFSNDELGQLADAFNEMMAKIEYQNGKLMEQHDKLARSTRMESLGLLAGGVAHDLNNILGPMVAFPDLIADRLPEGDPIRSDVALIGQSARRASVVIQDLLSLARRGNYHREIIDLNDLVNDCIQSPAFKARAQNRTEIDISTELTEELPPISGSEPHLTQAFLNLMINGVEAISEAGRLTIATRLEEIPARCDRFERIEAGTYVVLSVSDTGSGIPEHELDHIFEPFYSRKRMGDKSGSGLGLAVVYGVTKDHDACINVISTVGEGTCFEIYFVAQEAPEENPAEKRRDSTGTERILVVDDYEQQRIHTERILQHHGYSTRGARNGHEAIKLLMKERFDLMVLDMIMEDGFDGLDTYRECIKLQPGIRCVIATGFSENDRVKQALSLGASQCLNKPYTPTALGSAVRNALDAAKVEAELQLV